ncbi:hypothetical protein C8R43DRAFT_1142211 [Mycena crocata]|nr:hypothetical protein C8R43DRAFT_1142211 [Mycena crocata]
MHFQDLDEDILPQILVYCDIHTVLSIGRVNRLLHALTLKKELWLPLIYDLAFHGLIDLPPGETLQTYTVQDILDEVKRTVVGPKTWSPTCPSALPMEARKRILISPMIPNDGVRGITLLPGGKYLVLERFHPILSLEIWSLEWGSCVWLWQTPLIQHIAWSIDVCDGGMVAYVLVTGVLDPVFTVITRVAFDSGEESRVFYRNIPEYFFASDPILLGDFFCRIPTQRPHSAALVLVNWRDDTYVALERDASHSTLLDVALFPKHVLLASKRGHSVYLSVYCLDSAAMRSAARPLANIPIPDVLQTTHIAPDFSHRLRCGYDPSALRLSVHKSPLRRNTHIVALACVVPPPRSVIARLATRLARRDPTAERMRSTLYHFRAVSSDVPSLVLTLLSTAPATTGTCTRPSLAAYFWHLGGIYDAMRVRDGVQTAERRQVSIPLRSAEGRIVFLSPSSGAVVVLTNEEIVVEYFL